MNRRIMLAAVGLVAASITTSALAQESKPIGLSIRGGAFWPGSNAAQAEGKTWLAAGAEFRLQNLNFGMASPGTSSYLSVSVDYMGTGDFRSMPVLLNYVGRNNEFYYTAGAGYTFGRHVIAGPTVEDKNTFAYCLGVGYDFARGTMPFFVEGRYFGSSESDFNGFGVYLGVRL